MPDKYMEYTLSKQQVHFLYLDLASKKSSAALVIQLTVLSAL